MECMKKMKRKLSAMRAVFLFLNPESTLISVLFPMK